jgi:uncharacterized protein YebE (UPF0316 family)
MRPTTAWGHAGVMEKLLASMVMAGLAMASVALWTMRVALTARGRKLAGSVTAAVEALVFLFAFSRVVSDMTAIERIVGYALGVGLGTLLGVYLDELLAAGQSEVRIVTQGRDTKLVSDLHELGWPVTWTHAEGPVGEVMVAFVAIDDSKLRTLTTELERRRPDAFWTVESLRRARAGNLDRGWIQVGHRFPLGRRQLGQPVAGR